MDAVSRTGNELFVWALSIPEIEPNNTKREKIISQTLQFNMRLMHILLSLVE